MTKTFYKVYLRIQGVEYEIGTYSNRAAAEQTCEDMRPHFRQGAVEFRIDEIKTQITTTYKK